MANILTRSGKGSPLTNDEVDANFTNLNAGLSDWLAQFSVGRPIFIAGTGQSNGNGWGLASAYTSSANVKDWSTDGTQGIPQIGRAWRTPDTNTIDPKNDYYGLDNYIGYKGGKIGNISISMANYIANASGRTVYVVQVNRDAAPASFWNPTGGIGGGYNTGVVLAAEVSAALASIEITTWNTANPDDQIAAPDVLNIMQGESDAGGFIGLSPPETALSVSPKIWADTWLGYIKDPLSTYFKENHTRVIVYDLGQSYNWEEPRNANIGASSYAPWRWKGCSSLVEEGGNFFNLVSSVGIEDLPWDTDNTTTDAGQPFSGGGGIHFSGAGSNMQGEIGAKTLLGELSAGATNTNGWDMLEGDQSSRNLGMPYTLRNQNRTTYRSDGTTVARLAGKVEIDASTVEVTTVAGGTWSLGPSVQARHIVGTVSSTNDTWIEIMSIALDGGLASTERLTGFLTLESLEPAGATTSQLYSLNVYSVFGVFIGGTSSVPLGGTGGPNSAISFPSELKVVANSPATALSVQVRGGSSNKGSVKHRATYLYNDIQDL